MTTRLMSATAAVLLAAGAGLAQSPSLPPINPIPVAPVVTVGLIEPTAAPSPQQDRPQVPPPPVPPPAAPLPMATVLEQPCPECDGRFDAPVGPDYRFWARAEAGYFWLASAKLPVLVQDAAGAAVLGGHPQLFPAFAAGSVDFGFWLNDRHTVGFYGGGMMTELQTVGAAVASDAAGNPPLSRPFVNAITGLNDTLLVSGASGATVASGALAYTTAARLDGFNVGVVRNVLHDCNCTLNFTLGYRYLDLDESLAIYQSSHFPAGGPTYVAPHPAADLGPLTDVQITDRFRTRNQFHGVQFGLDGERTVGPFFVGLTPTVAFGTNRQTSDVDGSTTFTGTTGRSVTVPGGLYAVGIPGGPAGTEGIFGQNVVSRFSVLAEVTGRVGVQLTPAVRATAGYTFLYLNDVARPGLEIQPVINPRVIPVSQAFGSTSGPVAPRRAYDRTDYVAHGVMFGLEVRY
jgi:Putative beta barrel porin-7 (BBP7)